MFRSIRFRAFACLLGFVKHDTKTRIFSTHAKAPAKAGKAARDQGLAKAVHVTNSDRANACYPGLVTWQEHISIDPKVLVGKPVVKGTRLAVELIIDLLGKGWTQEQILESYPNLTTEDIRACLAYASEVLHAERVYPLTPA